MNGEQYKGQIEIHFIEVLYNNEAYKEYGIYNMYKLFYKLFFYLVRIF